jgi:hypothetical protein
LRTFEHSERVVPYHVACQVEKEAEKKPTAKAAPIAPPPVKPKTEELPKPAVPKAEPKPAVPKAEPKPVPKSVADPKVRRERGAAGPTGSSEAGSGKGIPYSPTDDW